MLDKVSVLHATRGFNLLLRRKTPPRSSRTAHYSTRLAMSFGSSSRQSDAVFPIYVSGIHSHKILGSHQKEFKLPEGGVLLWEAESKSTSFQEDNFNSHLYLGNANTSQFGTQLLWSPCLPSTHTLSSQNFHAFPLGTVCVADTQVSGKGRSSNVWESPKGCLMFSFTLQMDNGHMLPFLQYVVSIALVDAIHHVTLLKGLPILPVKIKWPNDIYANGVKIGGVLCSSTYREKKFDVVAGIGLNVGNQKPTTCLDTLLQEVVSEAPLYKREELLAAFFVKFEALFERFNTEGFGPLQSSYYEKWLHSGQEVVLEERQQDNSTVRVSLTIQGLTPTGYLLATDDQMDPYELHPDGNSFDFMKGLVRTKLQP
ncbi:hypothetical protein GOP47_0004553 [Adiantum capillus-veneris]|uniref:BPL/LPL catalytic domain-containing protein n=1 Tax=Adiantum capillus-veneris TaxID=13818 RepID=A0A9D4V7W2_ADICA|nr:hypothetical protein GOP47_0003961 [Adiantum capillus-veneris]KAI5081370.1 hypothetical protein GOP47_0004553 [Adiantum capillus-veneris]